MRYAVGMKRAAVCLMLAVVLLCSGCVTRPPVQGKQRSERTLLTTGYCPCKKCCNWKRTWYGKAVVANGPNKGKPKKVGMTASGKKARRGTIAADTSLYPFGTVMYIPGYGYGTVEDRGGAIKGQHIDLFFKHHKKAIKWGRQTKRIYVWLPR